MSKKEATEQVISSFIAFNVCLWGGSYITHRSLDTWASFPSFMTTVLACILCGLWFVGAISSYPDKK